MIKFKLIFFVLLSYSSFSQINDFKNINFNKADKIAYELKGENLKDLPKLSHNLTKLLSSDVEKFRAIYIWVCTNIENDYYLFEKNTRKRNKYENDSIKLLKWNKEISRQTFKKLIKQKKTVCTGYAYLIKELSNLANIKCEIVNGYGRTAETVFSKSFTPNHSWNAVELNSKWYLCDATWSSGLFDLNKNTFDQNYNDGYFLTNPKYFSKNHFPLDSKWQLVEEKLNFVDFKRFPLVYDESFKNNLISISPLIMYFEVKKNEEIILQLEKNKPINLDAIRVELVSGNYKKTIIPKITSLSDDIIELKFDFDLKGDYDLHIKINEDYISTYVVSVNKKKK